MKARQSLRAALVAALCCVGFMGTPAYAGRQCSEPTMPKKEIIENGLNLAQRTLDSLNKSGAQVVVLARAGQDLSKYGLRYSHLGFAYKQQDGSGPAVWRVLHELNECGTAESALYRQGLGDFFMDDMWRYEAVAVVPLPDIQAKLMAVITDPQLFARMHHKRYSMVAYVWGLKYQQSNQWATETFAMAMAPEDSKTGFTREQAQSWLRSNAYQPTTLKIGPLTRLGGRITAANIAFDDHPNEKRYSDRIETITVDSVMDWMKRAGYVDRIITYPSAVGALTVPQERVQQVARAKDSQAGMDAFRSKDYTKAHELLLPLASAGDKEAQFTMGLMLRNGYGRPKDTVEAMRWFRLSALQGYSPAEYNLGAMLAAGTEVPKDYAQAIQWLSRSSSHGNPGATALLAQVQAQRLAEEESSAKAAASSADSAPIVVKPDPQDAVAACVRASRVQCTDAEMETWKQGFLKSLRQTVRYPSQAARNGRSGVVVLNVVVCEDDTTPRVAIRVSSGSDELDQAALQAAKRLNVQALSCSGLRAPIVLTAPVAFSLDDATRATSR